MESKGITYWLHKNLPGSWWETMQKWLLTCEIQSLP